MIHLTVPGMFQVFHRYMPRYEIMIAGMKGNTDCFFVEIESIGCSYSFGYEILPNETILESIKNIFKLSDHFLDNAVMQEKMQLVSEKGGYHVNN